MKYEISEAVARKVVETVDQGLVHGLGTQRPGSMCVEAAVCFAMGLPHGDNPPCVGSAVRSYKIRLNDSVWSSNEARAKGMRRVAVAQLGSDEIDQKEFAKEVIVGGIRDILPIALRAAAKAVPAHAEALELAAIACEAIKEFIQAKPVAEKARSVARAAAAAAAAYAYADAYADAAADAAAAADAYADAARKKARDGVLSIAAEVAVKALIKLGSKGCDWLFLCDEPS